jgi:hypothetical protein
MIETRVLLATLLIFLVSVARAQTTTETLMTEEPAEVTATKKKTDVQKKKELEDELETEFKTATPDAPPNEPPYTTPDNEFQSEFQSSDNKPSAPPPALPEPPVAEPKTAAPSAPMAETTPETAPVTNEKPTGPQQAAPGYVLKPHPNAMKGLIRIEKNGTYVYKTKVQSSNKYATFGIGIMDPPSVKNEAGTTYKDVYGTSKPPIILFDYGWYPFKKFGRLGFSLGTGLLTANGNGILINDRTPAEEKYTLFAIPNHAMLNYRFQFSDTQTFVPYVTGGGYYFLVVETRDDGIPPTYTGAAAAGGGGGLLIAMNALDREAALQLNQEYGVNQVWLHVDFLVLQGLRSDFSFTSNVFNFGLAFDF